MNILHAIPLYHWTECWSNHCGIVIPIRLSFCYQCTLSRDSTLAERNAYLMGGGKSFDKASAYLFPIIHVTCMYVYTRPGVVRIWNVSIPKASKCFESWTWQICLHLRRRSDGYTSDLLASYTSACHLSAWDFHHWGHGESQQICAWGTARCAAQRAGSVMSLSLDLCPGMPADIAWRILSPYYWAPSNNKHYDYDLLLSSENVYFAIRGL